MGVHENGQEWHVGRGGTVPIARLGFKKHHLFPFSFLHFCHQQAFPQVTAALLTEGPRTNILERDNMQRKAELLATPSFH